MSRRGAPPGGRGGKSPAGKVPGRAAGKTGGGRAGTGKPAAGKARAGTGSSKSSAAWLARQRKDPFVRDAQSQGYRSRAAFKLLELERRYRLLPKSGTVLDLGAAPGGWTQVAVQHLGRKGRVVAVDLLAMDPVPGATFIQGDFLDPLVLPQLLAAAEGPADLVMSDMAPNLSGIRAADQAQHLELMDMALAACASLLKPGGQLLVKAFNGAGQEEWLREVRKVFRQVNAVKPEASRAESREVYLVARGWRGG